MSLQPGLTTKCILLVENEPQLLQFVRMVLKRAGFVVLAAATAEDAIRIARDYNGTVDLLLTGCKMPRLSGPELAKKLSKERPGLRVMLMSCESAAHTAAHKHNWYFIAKPFSPSVLLRGISEAVDGEVSGASTLAQPKGSPHMGTNRDLRLGGFPGGKELDSCDPS